MQSDGQFRYDGYRISANMSILPDKITWLACPERPEILVDRYKTPNPSLWYEDVQYVINAIDYINKNPCAMTIDEWNTKLDGYLVKLISSQ